MKYYTCKRCGLRNIECDTEKEKKQLRGQLRGSCCLMIVMAIIGCIIFGIMTGGIGFASLIFIILGALKVGSQHLGSQPDKKRTCPDCGSERLALQFEGFIDEKDNAQLKETPKKQWYDQ